MSLLNRKGFLISVSYRGVYFSFPLHTIRILSGVKIKVQDEESMALILLHLVRVSVSYHYLAKARGTMLKSALTEYF